VDTPEAVLHQRVPTEEAFADPARHDFVQGALWCFGEVLRRRREAARWQYNRAEPGSADSRLDPAVNLWAGRPFIEHDLPGGNATVPIFDLESLVVEGTPGYLRRRLQTF
jgi:hypothetical protein